MRSPLVRCIVAILLVSTVAVAISGGCTKTEETIYYPVDHDTTIIIEPGTATGIPPQIYTGTLTYTIPTDLNADGVTDDTAIIQGALDSAKASGDGNIVFLPTADYLIEGTIRVPAYTTLMGTYQGPGNRPGTTLLSTVGEGTDTGDGCIILNFGIACLKNIKITYPNQNANNSVPTMYPYAIYGLHSARIEEVYLHNPYQGINFDEAHGNLIRNVWGNPIKVGINVDHCFGLSRIENVHFWPYATINKPLETWIKDNGVGFQFGRSDWQHVLNCFTYGYHTGFRFYNSSNLSPVQSLPGGQTNGVFEGCGVDRGTIAVDIENCFEIGVSFDGLQTGTFGSVDGHAIHLRNTNGGNVQVTNSDFWAINSNIAIVEGGALVMSSCTIHNWAGHASQAGEACFKATAGRLLVDGNMFNQGGLVGDLSGANTRASFVNNVGVSTLTINSSIGARLVNANNNPAITVNP